jgi:hypothetical protein
MTDHGIVAAGWQWKATQQGLLSTVIVPLDPEPRKEGNTWVWPCEPMDLFWFDSEGVGERLLKKLPWQVGDLIFFQEEWCKGDWGAAFDDDIYFTKNTTPEAENIGWQPAHAMPKEAAQHWFEVTGVRIEVAGRIPMNTWRSTGIYLPNEDTFEYGQAAVGRWDKAHPGHLWGVVHWLIVLEVIDGRKLGEQ